MVSTDSSEPLQKPIHTNASELLVSTKRLILYNYSYIINTKFFPNSHNSSRSGQKLEIATRVNVILILSRNNVILKYMLSILTYCLIST